MRPERIEIQQKRIFYIWDVCVAGLLAFGSPREWMKLSNLRKALYTYIAPSRAKMKKQSSLPFFDFCLEYDIC